jgi:histidinol-phosphate phosphatase family protein
MEWSGKDLRYFDDQEPNKEAQRFLPHVIEPSAGADRATLAFLCDAYAEDEVGGEPRTVLKLHPRLAPYKAAVFPLVKKEGMPEKARAITGALRRRFNVMYDEKGAIGRRYRRQDEAGTPFCITVDGETLTGGTVTVRERDSCAQTRVAADGLVDYLADRIEARALPGNAPPVVLLDRDGVINRDSDEYIKSVPEWMPLPGSLEAIASLTAAGFRVVVISNQSGIGRGLFSETTLGDIHAAMRAAVEAAGGKLTAIYYCPHRPEDGCDCRKPKPGLLRRAAAELDFALRGVPLIGDKSSDVAAAVAVGARPIVVGSRAGERLPPGVERYADLAAAAAALIAERHHG